MLNRRKLCGKANNKMQGDAGEMQTEEREVITIAEE
jgi:hypothetical protein